jgi:hypothetical protein
MIRAGVFIGVDKAGHLQKLDDAARGARRMYEWALAQGMADRSHAKLITDEGGNEVDPDRIYDAIKEIIDGPGADQLIVYFAGHGVNINRSEHWLLTDAPVRTSAAVNVTGSVELARYCGIQHVVFISDACRVAPEGIQAQNVRGQDVFPNDDAGDRARPVDQFFACYLGKTAAELRDPAAAASGFSALYTGVMLDGLEGARPDLLEAATEPGDGARYVRPRRLQSYLEEEVPRRVQVLGLQNRVNQNPDAIITSDGNWLSRISREDSGHRQADLTIERSKDVFPPLSPPVNLLMLSRSLVRSAAAGDRALLGEHLRLAHTLKVPGAGALAETVEQVAKPFGPDHFETSCGVKVRGARIIDFFARRARGELLDGNLLRIEALDGPAASVLLSFERNVGTVIPVIDGFVAALTFEDGELVDVAYEPSANTHRWDRYQRNADEVRALRAVAASSSQHGRFRLERADAMEIAGKMQSRKAVDPTFAVYAAYAYHDLQEIDRIRAMSGFLENDVHVTFFDLALLSRELVGRPVRPDDFVVPFVPLLAQGWALLQAHRVQLPSALRGIERTLRESLWSLYDADGVDKLHQALQSGEVR